MPALKRFIPNIRLGREKKIEPCPTTVEDKSKLKRANARLHKREQSTATIQSGLGIVHKSLPNRDDLRFSRQNSFETGESVKDFDAVSPAHDRPQIVGGGSRSKFALALDDIVDERPRIITVDALLDPKRPPSQDHENGFGDLSPVSNRSNFEVSPIDLATAAAKSVLERRRLIVSKSSTDVRPVLRVVNASPEARSDSGEDPVEGIARLVEPKDRSKARSMDVRHLNWNGFGDEELRQIARTSDATLYQSISAEAASPADSAIALSRQGSRKRYSGKGKGRQNSRSSSRKVSLWLESQDQPIDERPSEIQSHGENRAAKSSEAIIESSLDDTVEQSGQKVDQGVSVDAIELKREQIEDQMKLLADAWEIENVRFREYLEHREKRDQEAQVRAKLDEERLKAEKLNKQLQGLLDEEVFQQALREIEEQERKEAEARLKAERAQLRDCCVCGDSKNREDFPIKTPTAGCDHPPTTCKECLESWMASEFETKGCDGIKCPECSQTLEYQEVQEAASKETFEAYDKLAMRNALGSLEEFAWCLGAGCGFGQLNIDNHDYMDCQNCGYKQCLRHKVPWHTSETCDQYEYRTSGEKQRDEEKKEEAMLNQLSKKCPGTNCGWRIEKIDGCEHMTCKKCKHEFCWQCLASHAEIKRVGNTAHAETCKFHSHNLDVTWPFNMH